MGKVRCVEKIMCDERKECGVVVLMVWWREKEDDVVGQRNLSGTYWVIVIRPQLSRTATGVRNASDRPISVLNRTIETNIISQML